MFAIFDAAAHTSPTGRPFRQGRSVERVGASTDITSTDRKDNQHSLRRLAPPLGSQPLGSRTVALPGPSGFIAARAGHNRVHDVPAVLARHPERRPVWAAYGLPTGAWR